MAWGVKVSAEQLALLMEAGFIYRCAGKFTEAREIFEGVHVLRPKSEIPHVALGTVDFEEARFADAIRRYNIAICVNPLSAYAYAHLGEAQLFYKDTPAARASLERAIELDPRSEAANLSRALLTLANQLEFTNS